MSLDPLPPTITLSHGAPRGQTRRDGAPSTLAGVEVDVSLAAGGRIRQIRLHDDSGSDPVEVFAEAPLDAPAWSTGWGSFPMAPWAGRVRQGRLHVFDRTTQLHLNHEDGDGDGGGPLHPPVPGPDDSPRRHAIHGTVFDRAWSVDLLETSAVEMHCRIDTALGWPFPGIARQRIEVTATQVALALVVESVDGAVFPASIGWHPWFAKPTQLHLDALAMYELDETGLPTGALVEPSSGPWDDCFVARWPIELDYDRAIASTITVSSDCDHVVIFDKPPHATCVEPQSGPPDALARRPQLVAPGMPLVRTMAIGWSPRRGRPTSD